MHDGPILTCDLAEATYLRCHPLQDDDLPGKDLDDTLGTFACPVSTLNPGKWKVNLTDCKGRVRGSRWLKVNLKGTVEDKGKESIR